MSDEDYNFKLDQFSQLTECDDYDIAINYLTEYNWDERLAASIYLNANSQKNQFEPRKTKENPTENDDTSSISNELYINLMNILNLETCSDFNSFIVNLNKNKKIGLFLIFNKNDIDLLTEIFFRLSDNDTIIEILSSSYSLYFIQNSLLVNSKESKESKEINNFLKKMNLNNSSHPTTVFIQNSNEIQEVIEGFLEYDFLCEKIRENAFKKPNSNSNSNIYNHKYNDNINDNTNDLSHKDLIEKQKKELEHVEKRAKEEEDLKRKLEKERNLQNESLKKKQSLEKKNKNDFISKLLPEQSNDKDSILIIFRLPNGTRTERRFNKKWEILQLYAYIYTLDSIFIDEESMEFDIIMSFPLKVFDNLSETIEGSGLTSNSILQVREK